MNTAIRESVAIVRGRRRLSGELSYQADANPAFAALVIGPHPYMGGTMQNALVTAITEALAEAGGLSLRFDYGGTGLSEGPRIDVAASMSAFWETGHAPEDPDRLEDAVAAFAFLDSLAVHPRILVGYSFGASAAWRLACRESATLAGLALVSPTLSRHPFPTAWPPRARRLLVIHSTDDFCTAESAVGEWVRSLPAGVEYSRHVGGNHFFRGAEHRIGQEVAEFITSRCRNSSEVAAC